MNFETTSGKRTRSGSTELVDGKGDESANLKRGRSGLAEDAWRELQLSGPGQFDFSSTKGGESFAEFGGSGLWSSAVDDGERMLSSSSSQSPTYVGVVGGGSSRNISLSVSRNEKIGRGRGMSESTYGPFSRAICPFTPSQWMELEHQALIYKHIVSNVPIPSNLLTPLKSSLPSYGSPRSYASNFCRGMSEGTHGPFARGICPFFTPSQWMELEHQALIYKHIVSNVPIPSNLLTLLKSSLPSCRSPRSYASNICYSRNNDPEPGRFRRTEGKKWRCSRKAVPDQRYCERHINRGRHRSRKHVEGLTGHAVTGSTPSKVAWKNGSQMGSSPTGVLQRSTFISLSNSSYGSPLGDENKKVTENSNLRNKLPGSTPASSAPISPDHKMIEVKHETAD